MLWPTQRSLLASTWGAAGCPCWSGTRALLAGALGAPPPFGGAGCLATWGEGAGPRAGTCPPPTGGLKFRAGAAARCAGAACCAGAAPPPLCVSPPPRCCAAINGKQNKSDTAMILMSPLLTSPPITRCNLGVLLLTTSQSAVPRIVPRSKPCAQLDYGFPRLSSQCYSQSSTRDVRYLLKLICAKFATPTAETNRLSTRASLTTAHDLRSVKSSKIYSPSRPKRPLGRLEISRSNQRLSRGGHGARRPVPARCESPQQRLDNQNWSLTCPPAKSAHRPSYADPFLRKAWAFSLSR